VVPAHKGCISIRFNPRPPTHDLKEAFISSFKKAKATAGIEGINFSDLRGTAVTRPALPNGTVPEICAITGHSHAEANAILEAHYLHRDPPLLGGTGFGKPA
jgi:hypothetical protein